MGKPVCSEAKLQQIEIKDLEIVQPSFQTWHEVCF